MSLRRQYSNVRSGRREVRANPSVEARLNSWSGLPFLGLFSYRPIQVMPGQLLAPPHLKRYRESYSRLALAQFASLHKKPNMKLVFQRKHKSITSLDLIDLPDFTVLTGVNGAGKSHLLEAIEGGAISIEGVPPNQPTGPRPIRRFDSNTLVPKDTGPFSAAQIAQEQTNFWTEIAQHKEQQINPFRDQLRQFGTPKLDALGIKELLALSIDELVALGVPEQQAPHVHNTIANGANNANNYVTNMFVRNDPANRTRLMTTLASHARMPIFAMEQDDFFGEYPKLWQPVDLFQQSFARLFTAYQRHWSQNKLKAIACAEGEKVDFLDDQQFIEKHGTPPWHFLNEILAVAELDFRINEPYKWDDRPYEPILTDEKRGIRIKFDDLSSGERILMSFALCLYHANDPNSSADFPKVILFDEIDAPLHPSMTRSLIRTIQQTLVDKHQIKVVLTTHSPSTVALAPDGSVHVMLKAGPQRLRSTSKDAALGILTAGVPTLSVNYQNRRQVFVESKYDAQYYTALFEISKPSLSPEVSLAFIAAGIGGIGGCEHVRSIVGQLASAGNRTTVGLIDWDRKNSSKGPIYVLAEQERYSIENILLDPILVGLLLVRERLAAADAIGLNKEFRYTDSTNLTQLELQSIADAVARTLEASALKAGLPLQPQGVTSASYAGGATANRPQWMESLQGHKLEELYKAAFSSLLRYRGEPDFKLAVIERVLADLPMLVPSSISAAFRRLQAHS